MTTLILGNITLLPDRAIVHDIRAILQCDSVNQAEALGEKLIYVYEAYLVPEAYKLPIKWECKKELSFAGPLSKPTVNIGDTLHTIADVREMISDLDDHCPGCDAEITPTKVRDIE